jgi:hypothetical protein
MPYKLRKYKGLYKVQNENSKEYYSKSWLPYEKALGQLRLLYAIEFRDSRSLGIDY